MQSRIDKEAGSVRRARSPFSGSVFGLVGLAVVTCLATYVSAAEPLQIAVAVPLTGARKALGAAVEPRVKLLADAFNANGGSAGRQLEITWKDDGCSREKTREIAEAIAREKPAVVIGHPCPTAAITAAPIYQQAGILFLAAGVRHAQLTEKRAGTLVFRAAGRDDRQGHDTGVRLRALAGSTGATMIIHDRTAMARTIAQAARDAARTEGAPPTEIATIVAGEADYTKAVDRIAATSPRALLFLGFPAEASIILRQVRQRGLTMPVLVNDAMATDEFIDQAGQLLDDAVEVMLPVSINRDVIEEGETSEALVASDVAAALGLWHEAVTATGTPDADAIAARLGSPREHVEETAFDGNGDARVASFAGFHYRNGSWRRADARP